MFIDTDDRGHATAHIMVPLTEIERRTFADDLAATVGKREDALTKLKELNKIHKDEIKVMEEVIGGLSHTLRMGKIEKIVPVTSRIDWDKAIKEVINSDTGEVVGELPITEEDRQLRLMPQTAARVRKQQAESAAE